MTYESVNLKYLVQIVLSAIIIMALFFFLEVQVVIASLGSYSFSILLFLVLLLVPSLFVRCIRWKMLFDNETHSVSFLNSLSILFVGQALNLVLPASSGDVAKSYFGYKWTGIKERMLSISVIEKVIALGSVGLLGLPLAYLHRNFLLTSLSGILVLIACFCVFVPPFFQHGRLLKKMLAAFTRYTKNKINFETLIEESTLRRKELFFAFCLSVLGWLFTYIQLFLCFYGIEQQISLSYVLLMAPLLTVVRLFPLTLSGYGSDEAVMCFFLSSTGMSPEQILAGALMYRFATMILPGLTGWLIIAGYKTRFKK